MNEITSSASGANWNRTGIYRRIKEIAPRVFLSLFHGSASRCRGGNLESDAVNRELIERARVGDQAALGELLEKYRRYLWGLADKLLDDRAAARIDASDIVQQTCLSVHKHIT